MICNILLMSVFFVCKDVAFSCGESDPRHINDWHSMCPAYIHLFLSVMWQCVRSAIFECFDFLCEAWVFYMYCSTPCKMLTRRKSRRQCIQIQLHLSSDFSKSFLGSLRSIVSASLWPKSRPTFYQASKTAMFFH